MGDDIKPNFEIIVQTNEQGNDEALLQVDLDTPEGKPIGRFFIRHEDLKRYVGLMNEMVKA